MPLEDFVADGSPRNRCTRDACDLVFGFLQATLVGLAGICGRIINYYLIIIYHFFFIREGLFLTSWAFLSQNSKHTIYSV
jgi:hypothetical protein